MSIITSQQITRYFNLYRSIDVSFTKGVVQATSLNPKQVFVKCLGDQWPCIIYATSMTSAKIIAHAGPTSRFVNTLKQANNIVSLRFSFKQSDKVDPLTFFVSARITAMNPYDQIHPDLKYITLTYTQRPPDDLIEILGKLLEANVNSHKRGEERIILTREIMRKVGLRAQESVVLIDGLPRKGILRDISFSGVKIIIMCVAKLLMDKEAVLKLEFDEPAELMDIPGKIVRFEPVEGRKDIAALAIRFYDDRIPMNYKIRVNEYLGQLRKLN